MVRVGHWAYVVWILADKLADAELATIPRFGEFFDPRGAAGEIGHPFAKLRADVSPFRIPSMMASAASCPDFQRKPHAG